MPRRKYGGHYDAAAAVEQVSAIASGDLDPGTLGTCATPFEDPTSALQGISASLMGVFEAHEAALDNLENALGEVDLPEGGSFSLIQVAAQVAIATAAGAIGGYVVERAHKMMRTGPSMKAFSRAEQKMIRLKAVDAGELKSAAVVAAIEDGSKEVFSVMADAAVQAIGDMKEDDDANIGATPLTHFLTLQRRAVGRTKRKAALALARLWRPLGQAGLPALNALASELCKLADDAEAIYLEAALREWQNFQARWVGGASKESKRDALPDGDGDGFSRVAGVLAVVIDVHDKRPSETTVAGARLNGANRAVRQYYRDHGGLIRDLAINKNFRLRFNAHHVDIAAGPDSGLRFDLLSVTDVLKLKAYVYGDPVDLAEAYVQAYPERYDAISRANAVEVARSIIKRAWETPLKELLK
jgi:hypothetical protein